MAKYQTGYNLYHQFGQGTGGTLNISMTHTGQVQQTEQEHLSNDVLQDYYNVKLIIAILILTYIFLLKIYSIIFKRKI